MINVSIDHLKEIAAKHKSPWFDDSTMLFFNTTFETTGFQATPDSNYVFFITSEHPSLPKGYRRFTIRKFNLHNAVIDNVDKFQQFSTLEKAKQILNTILKGLEND